MVVAEATQKEHLVATLWSESSQFAEYPALLAPF
jgi:hypothetical protein